MTSPIRIVLADDHQVVQKLGLSSRADLVGYALERGLIAGS
jgi:hypothetical protein